MKDSHGWHGNRREKAFSAPIWLAGSSGIHPIGFPRQAEKKRTQKKKKASLWQAFFNVFRQAGVAATLHSMAAELWHQLAVLPRKAVGGAARMLHQYQRKQQKTTLLGRRG